jgi:hypothetical protein
VMELEAGMVGQPGLDQLALAHSQVVQHEVHGGDGWSELLIEDLRQLEELDLAFAAAGRVV